MTVQGFNKRVQEFLREQAALQKDNVFLWWPVFLGMGIGFYFSLGFEPPMILGLVAFAVLVALFVFMRQRGFTIALFFLCLFALGFTAGQVRTALRYTPILEKETRALEIIAVINSIERLEPGQGSRIVFRDLEINEDDLNPEEVPVKVRLKVRKDEGLKVGQRVQVLAKMMPPSPPVMPGGFDFQRFMYFKQIGGVGFAFYQPEILDESESAVRDYAETLREAIGLRVKRSLEHPQSAVARALIVAERGEIPESDAQAMRDSGLAHLLAISGLHVGLFSGVVFFVVRLFLVLIPGMALKYPIKKYAAVIAFSAACFYAFLAGAPISTQRALIMIGVVFLAILLDRSPFSLRLVALAAFLVLLIQPESLLSASFHMSFGAVTGLIAFYEWLRPYSAAWYRQSGFVKRAALYFLSAVMTTLIASSATAPFVLFHFQQMPTYSILANVVAVPMMAFVIMPSAVLGLFLMPLGLEYWPLQIMGYGIAQVLDIAHWFANVPGAVVKVPVFPVSALVCFVIGVLVFILWRGWLKVAAFGFLAIGVCQVFVHQTYDVLVSSDFSLVMFRDDGDQFHISSRRKEKFVAENWEDAYGVEPGSAFKWPKEGGDDGFVCDQQACRLELGGKRISFLRGLYVFRSECGWADMVISFEYLDDKGCAGTLVFDPRDGWRHGAYGFWIDDQGVQFDTAQNMRGVRPWVSRRDRQD